MECFNGAFRYREKLFLGLKKRNSSILDGFYIYYNLTCKHQALDEFTPAESTGIVMAGKNHWKVLAQNASLKK